MYGSTTVSDTFGDGTTEYVFMILSGYSSLILEIRSVPMPDPVPPPKEWVNWNPWRQSHASDSFLTTSKTESTSSAPDNKTIVKYSVARLINNFTLEWNRDNNNREAMVLNIQQVVVERSNAKIKNDIYLLCNVPWPSCCQLQTVQRQSCQV